MDNIYPVTYHAKIWYDGIDPEDENVSGITFAHDFAEAARNIEKYYRETLISLSIMLLECCGDTPIYELPNSVVSQLEQE